MEDSPYTLAQKLKEVGFGTTTNPMKTAREGNRVLVLIKESKGFLGCRRAFFEQLTAEEIGGVMIERNRIIFPNRGMIEIYSASVDITTFRGRDRNKNFVYIYKD